MGRDCFGSFKWNPFKTFLGGKWDRRGLEGGSEQGRGWGSRRTQATDTGFRASCPGSPGDPRLERSRRPRELVAAGVREMDCRSLRTNLF